MYQLVECHITAHTTRSVHVLEVVRGFIPTLHTRAAGRPVSEKLNKSRKVSAAILDIFTVVNG